MKVPPFWADSIQSLQTNLKNLLPPKRQCYLSFQEGADMLCMFFDYSGINIKRILSRGGNRIDHILDERNCLTLCIIHRSLHQGSAVSTLNLSGLHSHDRLYHSNHPFS